MLYIFAQIFCQLPYDYYNHFTLEAEMVCLHGNQVKLSLYGYYFVSIHSVRLAEKKYLETLAIVICYGQDKNNRKNSISLF